MSESLLCYEQDEVQLLVDSNDVSPQMGKLRIIEKFGFPVVEWISSLDGSSDSDEWALIGSTVVSYSINESASDSVKLDCKKIVSPISIPVEENHYCKVIEENKRLEMLNSKKQIMAAFQFHVGHWSSFFDVLSRYVTVRQMETDSTLHLIQNKCQADLDDKLSALDLVSGHRKSPRKSPNYHHHWTAQAPRKVWGFLHNMKRDPYNTTLTTLSKFYDVVLYGQEEAEEAISREESSEVGEFLQRISGMDDLEPGYEILTKREELAPRPDVSRLTPLSPDEFSPYVAPNGVIQRVPELQERIFKGGIHPNLRVNLWCYLLDVYDWGMTTHEKDARQRTKEKEYYIMKKQWKTISQDQERNFSGYRDRKSIIEKDVNRTDRTHPFYEGSNPHLELLNDILMTYVMYNFDLGYVQGMSDLLAPILYVVQNESMAFWCFVGFMDRVGHNFDLDQSGMKQQLCDLTHLLRILDPEFVSLLESQDSANMFFCFRWILVRFKRELSYADTLRLWEVLWTDHLCPNFHLCFAAAILDGERKEIMENKFGFTEILKHVNGLCMRIDIEAALNKAEAMYIQLSQSPTVPNVVRSVLNLPPKVEPKPSGKCISPVCLPGHVERVSPNQETQPIKPASSSPIDETSSLPIHLPSTVDEEFHSPEGEIDEKGFERAVLHSFQ